MRLCLKSRILRLMTRIGAILVALLRAGWGQKVRPLRSVPSSKPQRLEESDGTAQKKPYIPDLPHRQRQRVVDRQVCESLDDPVLQTFMVRCLEARHVMLVSRAGSGCEKPAGALSEPRSRAPVQDKATEPAALFPNPTHEAVTLQMPEPAPWTARLYNSLGEVMATYTFEGTETILSLPPQKGLYWVVVEGAGQTYRLPLLRE